MLNQMICVIGCYWVVRIGVLVNFILFYFI